MSTTTHEASVSRALATPPAATSAGEVEGSEYTGRSICRPRETSCSTAAGRRRSAATSSGDAPEERRRWSASLAAVVVLPDPWRPTSATTVGACEAGCSLWSLPLNVAVSSSLTALTTWAEGLIPVRASVPTTRSRTRAMRSRATRKFTSASSRAMRTSFSAASTSLSVRRPRLLRRPKIPVSRSVSASNIVSLCLPSSGAVAPLSPSIVACWQSRGILRRRALDRSAPPPICWGRKGGCG